MKIYNTRTRQKEEFVPVDPKGEKVGLYYCGPTVYDSLHLGHGRAAVVPDMMRRYLEYKGYQVRYVTNFTDVDDKIITRSIEENRSWREVTSTYMEESGRVTCALGNRPPDGNPRATDHIDEMIELAERLIDRGHAYVATNGDVYFDVTSSAAYGTLSGRKLEDQLVDASGRLEGDEIQVKRSPGDFIVWKLNANDSEIFRQAGDLVPGWQSPWGVGRPGWHLECAALSKLYLGLPFDIHGGGTDLLFPHHENESIQCRCAWPELLHDGEEPVRYWVHNGFITVKARDEAERQSEYADGDSVKMSKSLGNVKWLREMFWPEGPYDPLAIRMMLLSSHYRSPIAFSGELLDQATQRLDKIYNVLDSLERAGLPIELACDALEGHALSSVGDEVRSTFESAMDDDFNTAGALAAIYELASTIQRELFDHQGVALEGDEAVAGRVVLFRVATSLLGVLGFPPRRLQTSAAEDSSQDGLLDLLGRLRQQARANKQYELGDQIRDELVELGFEIRDRPGGEFEIRRR